MLLESATLDLLANHLALSFDEDHRRANDVRLLLHRPHFTATPLGNPLTAFAGGIEMLGAFRHAVLEQSRSLQQDGHVEFTVHGDEVGISQRPGGDGPLDMTIATDAGTFDTFLARAVKLGMLHQALAETLGVDVGWSHWTIDRFEMLHMVQPPVAQWQEPPVALLGIGPEEKAAAFKLLGEDLQMLTKERMVIGLRSKWARRVATPMWQAYRAVALDDTKQGALTALEIIRQCQNFSLRQAVETYLSARFAINMEMVP